MKKKFIVIIMLFVCIFFAGCAANNAFLMTNQKQLALEIDEGGVLLSFLFTTNYQMIPNALYIQEINQYKNFNNRKIQAVSISNSDRSDGAYLFNVKLPQGRYLLTSVGGMTTSFFAQPVFASCRRMFDVVPGQITYLGRIKANPNYGEVEDNYEEDVQFFTTKYPLLMSEEIKKSILY